MTPTAGSLTSIMMVVVAMFAARSSPEAVPDDTIFRKLDEIITANNYLTLTESVLVSMMRTQREILQRLTEVADNTRNITRTKLKYSMDEEYAHQLEEDLGKEKNNSGYLTSQIFILQDKIIELENQMDKTTTTSTTPATTTPTQRVITQCKRFYEVIGTDCLRFKLTETKTWHEARADCQLDGGELAVQFDPYLVSQRLRGETVYSVHVGASSLYTNGNWWWLKTGAAVNPEMFAPGKPGDETCGALSRHHNFRMVDVSCGRKMPYICQILPDDIWKTG